MCTRFSGSCSKRTAEQISHEQRSILLEAQAATSDLSGEAFSERGLFSFSCLFVIQSSDVFLMHVNCNPNRDQGYIDSLSILNLRK